MFGLGPTEIVVILIVFVIVFGAGKLPSVLGDVGKGLRVFKKEVKDLDDKKEIDDE